MKENVLDVLMYLFENYIDEDTDIEPDRERLESHLLDAGFAGREIDRAFDWLEGLADQRTELHHDHPKSLRVYTDRELTRLPSESRGFLLFLEQSGVLTPATREVVIDRIMALESEEVDLEQLKWVVLMVLFNQPGHEAAYAWIEDMVLQDAPPYLH